MSVEGVVVAKRELPWQSNGLVPRIKNVRWASRHQADINHITGDVHFVALGIDKRRTILTIHDLDFLQRSRGLKRRLLKLFWFTLPLRRVARVTVISEETRRQLLSECSIPAGLVTVIPNAVSPLYTSSPPNTGDGDPRILQIGTKHNKNLPRLIEALDGIRCRLDIVGRTTDHQRMMLSRHGIQYQESSNLSDTEMLAAYQNADLVSLVSTVEGFGMPIIEAQWVERPVVTSNCSSMPEVAGDAACLVDPYDVSSIRAGIKRVLDDSAYRDNLVQRGRSNRERFSIDSVAKQYLTLYEQVYAEAQRA